MRFSAFKPFPRQTNGHRGIYVDAIFIPKGCSLDERKNNQGPDSGDEKSLLSTFRG